MSLEAEMEGGLSHDAQGTIQYAVPPDETAADGCSAGAGFCLSAAAVFVSMAVPPAGAEEDGSWEKTEVNIRTIRNIPSPHIFRFRDCLMVSRPCLVQTIGPEMNGAIRWMPRT